MRLPILRLLLNEDLFSGRCRDDTTLLPVFGPLLAAPVSALLSFCNLKPPTRIPDAAQVWSLAMNSYILHQWHHDIVMTLQLPPCSLQSTLFLGQIRADWFVDESDSLHKDPASNLLWVTVKLDLV